MTAATAASPSQDVRTPSPSQLRAIEAQPGPLLVLAGPGAGKTYCLIERIRHLIEHHGFDPERICAFTFTNKAAGEIAQRLGSRLGAAATLIRRSTLHAFCADLLRKHGSAVGLDAGFGIADEQYQLGVLARLRGKSDWHRSTLGRFSAHRFRGDPLRHEDVILLDAYERFLCARNVVDFDMLVTHTADLLERADIADSLRARWDVVLVDEFQDLNQVQYRVIRALASEHRHVFAVGDDEQSIYSWAGADPRVFTNFVNDFGLTQRIHLEENRRCPHDVFALARRLVMSNTPLFADRVVPVADRSSSFEPRAVRFESDATEAAWIVDDVQKDRACSGHDWSEVALLYRKHEIGDFLESALLKAGVPCRLPRGRALSDDPTIAYVVAAARVITAPGDEMHREAFFRAVLPGALWNEAVAKSQERGATLFRQLNHMLAQLPRADESRRRIRRAVVDWRNLEATGRQHENLSSLVQELLSRRVGPAPSALDDRHDEISDPAALPDVVALAARLREARSNSETVWLAPMGGVDIPLKGMLRGIGIRAERGVAPQRAMNIDASTADPVELPLALFKAAQLVEMDVSTSLFNDFTTMDVETTDRDTRVAEIVELSAVRVRSGRVAETFTSFVRPRGAMSPDAAAVHGIGAHELRDAPLFEEVWPRFREFCGSDIVVAHNGWDFDFPVLRRAVAAAGGTFDLCTYDTLPLARDLIPTSRKLADLARRFGVPTGQSHRALDDSVTLAGVVMALSRLKEARSRKTALTQELDHLGVALALCEEARLGGEARMFRDIARVFALGRYTDCLEFYEREQGSDETVPTVDEVIGKLGGVDRMLKIRAGKSADERYPSAMRRLRRVIDDIPATTLDEQIVAFLERAALSRWDGDERETGRVNLLTLHSTKGLEFSRVYIVGAEDAQLPGTPSTREPTALEIEEARRLLYVGMTRTIDRLVLTHAGVRGDKETGGHRFLDEMGLAPLPPA